MPAPYVNVPFAEGSIDNHSSPYKALTLYDVPVALLTSDDPSGILILLTHL